MDTLFHVVDASLFAQLVDLKDSDPAAVTKDFATMYKDVRACVDLCHRDGTIKDLVAQDPKPYIKEDPNLIPMLRAYKNAGKKVFLLTNSYWEYTNVVMNFLWGNDVENRDLDWIDLFDVVICGATKPHFLTDPYLNLFRVRTEDGTLENTDGAPETGVDEFLAKGKVFQGGNFRDLHRMLELSSGERLLYVGDHMYSDVLRTKRSLGWRTCLIIPELEHEIDTLNGNEELIDNIARLRREQYEKDLRVDDMVTHGDVDEEALSALDEAQAKIKEELRAANEAYHHAFHPTWGQLFKAGYQDSQFSKQVQTYACLYTGKASNLGHVAPLRHFRPAMDRMPHELET
mmetsp:Transcript_32036/g.101948  ORF Transcript_32036/g.101948 Transcript_32036/m.101948 type:complete len:345 (-) Transcript_32036:206-1240(-)